MKKLLPLLALLACTEEPTLPPVVVVPTGWISLGIVEDTGDSLRVEIVFDTATGDPAGVAQLDWQNWGVNPAQDTITGSTLSLIDTMTVRRPALGVVELYEIRARAVDGDGIVGDWSLPQRWAIRHLNVFGPAPPIILDPAPDDTFDVTSAVAVGVWPDSSEIETGAQVQQYAAVVQSDATIHCTVPAPAPGALYDSGTFCCGCDSAMIVAAQEFANTSAVNVHLMLTGERWPAAGGPGRPKTR